MIGGFGLFATAAVFDLAIGPDARLARGFEQAAPLRVAALIAAPLVLIHRRWRLGITELPEGLFYIGLFAAAVWLDRVTRPVERGRQAILLRRHGFDPVEQTPGAQALGDRVVQPLQRGPDPVVLTSRRTRSTSSSRCARLISACISAVNNRSCRGLSWWNTCPRSPLSTAWPHAGHR
jgi:hypothetical protein